MQVVLADFGADQTYTGCNSIRRSRDLIQASSGRAARTIHSLPITWPGRRSKLPKASVKNTMLSMNKPTTLLAVAARTKPRRWSGVYTSRSAVSEGSVAQIG